jgi:hypothetical protein
MNTTTVYNKVITKLVVSNKKIPFVQRPSLNLCGAFINGFSKCCIILCKIFYEVKYSGSTNMIDRDHSKHTFVALHSQFTQYLFLKRSQIAKYTLSHSDILRKQLMTVRIPR